MLLGVFFITLFFQLVFFEEFYLYKKKDYLLNQANEFRYMYSYQIHNNEVLSAALTNYEEKNSSRVAIIPLNRNDVVYVSNNQNSDNTFSTLTNFCAELLYNTKLINTVLDAIFVMVFHWGMAGAALATIIGQIISAIIVIRYLLHFKTVSLTKEHFRPQIEYISKTAQIGMASFFNQVAMMVVQIIMNNSLTHYGAASVYGDAIPLACAGIVIKVNQIFFSIVIGLSQGSQPVESFNYGAKNYDRVRKAFSLAATSGVIISIVSFVLFQIFPRQILGLFGTGEPEYFEFGVRFFRIFLFFIWLDALQPITSTFFTSIGKPAKGIFLSLTRQIIFFIPLLLILPRFMGIEGCIYCGPIADFLSAVVTIIMAFLEFKNMPKTNGE